MMIHDTARMSRQEEIIHPDFHKALVLIAGCGMLGSWSALAIARCAQHVMLFDHDIVEDVNSGNQAYNAKGVGIPKVQALYELGTGLPLSAHEGLFPIEATPDSLRLASKHLFMEEDIPLVVVSAVDSFQARMQIAAWARMHNATLFIDTRAMAEIAVVACVPHAHIERYLRDECIDDAQAPDAPCGLHGTAYVGQYVAALVTARINTHFRGLPVPFITVDDVGMGHRLREEKL